MLNTLHRWSSLQLYRFSSNFSGEVLKTNFLSGIRCSFFTVSGRILLRASLTMPILSTSDCGRIACSAAFIVPVWCCKHYLYFFVLHPFAVIAHVLILRSVACIVSASCVTLGLELFLRPVNGLRSPPLLPLTSFCGYAVYISASINCSFALPGLVTDSVS